MLRRDYYHHHQYCSSAITDALLSIQLLMHHNRSAINLVMNSAVLTPRCWRHTSMSVGQLTQLSFFLSHWQTFPKCLQCTKVVRFSIYYKIPIILIYHICKILNINFKHAYWIDSEHFMIIMWLLIYFINSLLNDRVTVFPVHTYIASPPNSTPKQFPSYLLLTFFLYSFIIFYHPGRTLMDFSSISS